MRHNFREKVAKFMVKIIKNLRSLFKLIVPRYLFHSVRENFLRIKLHGFCDSSMKDYSALCYIRVITKRYFCEFIMWKS